MSALTDPVPRGKKDPSQDFLQDFDIIGGGEVRQRLKDGTAVEAAGIHFRDNGEIIQAELFICDVKEVDSIETDYDDGKAGEM